jgi:hypothetical protein
MSRIANWDKMIDIEKENTLRVCKSFLSLLVLFLFSPSPSCFLSLYLLRRVPLPPHTPLMRVHWYNRVNPSPHPKMSQPPSCPYLLSAVPFII